MGRSRRTTDDRPDEALVQVRHKDHDDSVSPGVVSLGWLRQFGGDNWVEVGEATDEQTDALTGQEG